MRNGSSILGTYAYNTIPFGALGYNNGITIAPDGSVMMVKTDGAGAWRRVGDSGHWHQAIRRDNTSAALFDLDPSFGESDGTWELHIGPDSLTCYASFRHRIIKSLDAGANWQLCTAIPEQQMNSNAQGGSPNSYQRLAFCKMAVDPTNPAVVYWVPEGASGLQRTLDGMDSYSVIATVPAPVSPYSRSENDDRYGLVAIDETSALVDAGTSTERHSIVVCVSIGNGVYRSTDGGTTFTQISSTLLYPSNIQFINGVLWLFNRITTGSVSAGGTNIYTYNGSWSSAFGFSQNAVCVAVDPTDSSILYECRWMYRSNNGGSTWTDLAGGNGDNLTFIPHDAPLPAIIKNATPDLTSSQLVAHPSNGRVYWASGTGTFYMLASDLRAANKTTPVLLPIHEDTAGIEDAVPQYCKYTSAGTLVLTYQDKAVEIPPADRSQYPTACYPLVTLTNGYGIDYAAQDPNYIAVQIAKNSVRAAFTTDGTIGGFQPFPVTGATAFGGSICVVDVGKVIIIPGQNSWPRVTHDGGNSWADSVFSGFSKPASGETGWGFGTAETQRHIICNDKANPLNVYMYNYGVSGSHQGIWKSTDGGLNFTKVSVSNPIPSLGTYHNYLRYEDGILWLNQSYTTPYNADNGNKLYRSVDEGATFQQVPGLTSIYFYDFGKAAPAAAGGGSYKALYAEGYYNGVKGTHRCDNANAATIGNMAWTTVKVSEAFARPTAFAADPSTFGRVCVGRGGTSFEELTLDHTLRLS